MSVKVFGYTKSTFTMRVILTGFELGHPVELVPLDFIKLEHKQPEHLIRQPFGMVPAAQDGDFVFYESVAICRYLNDKYGGDLIPTNLNDRAIFEQWMSLEATTYTPLLRVMCESWFDKVLRDKDSKNTPEYKKAVESLMRDGAVLNNQLEGKTWIVNDKFSLVDICLVTYLAPHPFAEEPEIQAWFEKYPNIGRWFKSITARPAFQKAQSMQVDLKSLRELLSLFDW